MGKRSKTKKTPQRDRLGRARKHLGEAHAYDQDGHQSYRMGSIEAALTAIVDYLEHEEDERDSAMRLVCGEAEHCAHCIKYGGDVCRCSCAMCGRARRWE